MNKKELRSMIGTGYRGIMLEDEFEQYAGDLSEYNRVAAYQVLVEGRRASDVARAAEISRQRIEQILRRIKDRMMTSVLTSAREAGDPCIQCEHRRKCADQFLACNVFKQFVMENKYNPRAPRQPYARALRDVFREVV